MGKPILNNHPADSCAVISEPIGRVEHETLQGARAARALGTVAPKRVVRSIPMPLSSINRSSLLTFIPSPAINEADSCHTLPERSRDNIMKLMEITSVPTHRINDPGSVCTASEVIHR